MIKRLLIANRGEIACRIIRTAHQLGIATIAIYSDADAQAQHVKLASESYALGGHTANESYLNSKKIIGIAQDCDADAIHPGYGFLSEDANFCRMVQSIGLIFVGPSSENIDLMGNKERAKLCARKIGLPVAQDFSVDINDPVAFTQAANRIGYPLLVKASAGGGGKGMRLVTHANDLTEALQAAAREAEASFGDAAVFLEQYIRPARHIEVQIARDHHGNTIHLYTRECSIQRRHQKIIEEAPAHIPDAVQQRMCQVSIDLANHINYLGLGTVEFLLDQRNQFYFMEMNTRLQVEHPITELITQTDCVALQLQIAAGNPLHLKQVDITCQGHAIEARICAEEPLNHFMPSTGTLEVLQIPTQARFDTGVIQGDVISPFYDSMIAKLIGFGSDRIAAIDALQKALSETHIVGPHTNVAFISGILQTKAFLEKDICTEFIEKKWNLIITHLEQLTENEKQACAQAYLNYRAKYQKRPFSNDYFSPWMAQDNWRIQGDHRSEIALLIDAKAVIAKVRAHEFAHYHAYESKNELHVFINGKQLRISISGNNISDPQAASDQTILSSPMPGTVTQVRVQVGDRVLAGDTVVSIEAMKMEHAIKTHFDATVKSVHVQVGDTTEENQPLIELTP